MQSLLLTQTNNLTALNDTAKIKAVTDIAMTLSNLTKQEEEEDNFAEEIDIAVDIVQTIGR